jgi:molybdenum cofactor cytidylyltransferase
MGSPKLLLPWGRHTVIAQVLAAWNASQVERTVVVVGPRGAELASICRAAGALVVEAREQPADMKASVRLGLRAIEAQLAPGAEDAWLLAPADMPLLSAALVDRVIDAWKHARPPERGAVFVATRAGRRGHPVLFPWPYAAQVFRLADGQGINCVVEAAKTVGVPCDAFGIGEDLDTPDDYRRLRPP